MRLICSQTLCRSSPLCMTCIRRWSSSLIIRLNFSSRSMATARAPWPSASSRLMRCRSTRNWRSTSSSSSTFDVEQFAPTSRCPSTRSRRIFSICVRSCGVARLMNGKSARFRARRMRLLMTMSASGPAPRSHSPLFVGQIVEFHGIRLPAGFTDVRLSIRWIWSRSCDARSYSLFVDGFLHLAAQADQLGAFLAAPSGTARALAHVLRLAVDVQDQRFQLLLEADVVVRAAQPPLAAELVKRDAADGHAC